jgi:hypothetical protein
MEERRRTRRKLRRRQRGGISFGSLGSKLGSLGSKLGSLAKKGVSATKSGISSLKSKFGKKSEGSSTSTETPSTPEVTATTTETKPITFDSLKEKAGEKLEKLGFKPENIKEATQQFEHDVIPAVQQELNKTEVTPETINALAEKGLQSLPTANEALAPIDAMVAKAKELEQQGAPPSSTPTKASELDAATKAVEVISRVGTQQQKDEAVNALITKLRGGKRTRRARKHKKKNRTKRH